MGDGSGFDITKSFGGGSFGHAAAKPSFMTPPPAGPASQPAEEPGLLDWLGSAADDMARGYSTYLAENPEALSPIIADWTLADLQAMQADPFLQPESQAQLLEEIAARELAMEGRSPDDPAFRAAQDPLYQEKENRAAYEANTEAAEKEKRAESAKEIAGKLVTLSDDVFEDPAEVMALLRQTGGDPALLDEVTKLVKDVGGFDLKVWAKDSVNGTLSTSHQALEVDAYFSGDKVKAVAASLNSILNDEATDRSQIAKLLLELSPDEIARLQGEVWNDADQEWGETSLYDQMDYEAHGDEMRLLGALLGKNEKGEDTGVDYARIAALSIEVDGGAWVDDDEQGVYGGVAAAREAHLREWEKQMLAQGGWAEKTDEERAQLRAQEGTSFGQKVRDAYTVEFPGYTIDDVLGEGAETNQLEAILDGDKAKEAAAMFNRAIGVFWDDEKLAAEATKVEGVSAEELQDTYNEDYSYPGAHNCHKPGCHDKFSEDAETLFGVDGQLVEENGLQPWQLRDYAINHAGLLGLGTDDEVFDLSLSGLTKAEIDEQAALGEKHGAWKGADADEIAEMQAIHPGMSMATAKMLADSDDDVDGRAMVDDIKRVAWGDKDVSLDDQVAAEQYVYGTERGTWGWDGFKDLLSIGEEDAAPGARLDQNHTAIAAAVESGDTERAEELLGYSDLLVDSFRSEEDGLSEMAGSAISLATSFFDCGLLGSLLSTAAGFAADYALTGEMTDGKVLDAAASVGTDLLLEGNFDGDKGLKEKSVGWMGLGNSSDWAKGFAKDLTSSVVRPTVGVLTNDETYDSDKGAGEIFADWGGDVLTGIGTSFGGRLGTGGPVTDGKFSPWRMGGSMLGGVAGGLLPKAIGSWMGLSKSPSWAGAIDAAVSAPQSSYLNDKGDL